MKLIKYLIILIALICTLQIKVFCQTKVHHYSALTGGIPIDSIFIKYKAPISDENKLALSLDQDKEPIVDIVIIGYFAFDKEGKVIHFVFDRLYNLSSEYLKSRNDIWQSLEDSIKMASKEWIAKPYLIKDVINTNAKNSEKPYGTQQFHMIIFSFSNKEIEFSRYYWIRTSF